MLSDLNLGCIALKSVVLAHNMLNQSINQSIHLKANLLKIYAYAKRARCARQGKFLDGGAAGARNGGAIELRLGGERRAARRRDRLGGS